MYSKIFNTLRPQTEWELNKCISDKNTVPVGTEYEYKPEGKDLYKFYTDHNNVYRYLSDKSVGLHDFYDKTNKVIYLNKDKMVGIKMSNSAVEFLNNDILTFYSPSKNKSMLDICENAVSTGDIIKFFSIDGSITNIMSINNRPAIYSNNASNERNIYMGNFFKGHKTSIPNSILSSYIIGSNIKDEDNNSTQNDFILTHGATELRMSGYVKGKKEVDTEVVFRVSSNAKILVDWTKFVSAPFTNESDLPDKSLPLNNIRISSSSSDSTKLTLDDDYSTIQISSDYLFVLKEEDECLSEVTPKPDDGTKVKNTYTMLDIY